MGLKAVSRGFGNVRFFTRSEHIELPRIGQEPLHMAGHLGTSVARVRESLRRLGCLGGRTTDKCGGHVRLNWPQEQADGERGPDYYNYDAKNIFREMAQHLGAD